MRLLALFVVLLAAVMLTACSGDDNADEVSTVSSEPSPAYDDDTIWAALAPSTSATSTTPPDLNLTRSLQQCGPPQGGSACIKTIMRGEGATASAMDFLDTTGWILVGLRDFGPVDLGTLVSPWRANANRQYVMLNGNPELIYAEDEGVKLKLPSDPAYQPLVDAVTASGTGAPGTATNVIIFAADNAFEDQVSVEAGGQRIVFQYDVVNGCHACGTGYRERVGFDFDTTGQYLGATMLGLCRGALAPLEVAGVADCPPTQS